jgi:Flp pilus assembly protein TadG
MLQASLPGRKTFMSERLSALKARRGEEGSSIIELSLVLYFFLIPMLLGIFGVGMLVYDSIEVSEAARDGASYAAFTFRDQGTLDATSLANITTFTKSAEPNIPASALALPATTAPVIVTCGCLATGSSAQVTGSCVAVGPGTCSSPTPNLFVTVRTQANVAPLVNLSFLGFPATVRLNGSSTFPMAP